MCKCGLNSIKIEKIKDYIDELGYRVSCSTCAQVGPMRDTEDRAIIDYFDNNMHSPEFIDGCSEVISSKKFGGNFK